MLCGDCSSCFGRWTAGSEFTPGAQDSHWSCVEAERPHSPIVLSFTPPPDAQLLAGTISPLSAAAPVSNTNEAVVIAKAFQIFARFFRELAQSVDQDASGAVGASVRKSGRCVEQVRRCRDEGARSR